MGDAEANQAAEDQTPPGDLDTRERLVRQRTPAEGRTATEKRTRRRKVPAAPSAAAPAPGWQRLVLRNRYGVDHDCAVLDANKDQVLFYISSGFFLRSTGEVRTGDRDGAARYVLRGRVLDLPRQIVIREPDGKAVARVRAKLRSPMSSPIQVRLASGTEWETIGSLAKRQYDVAEAGKSVIKVDQKWVQIRDSCKVDVADGIDPALAAAVVWAIDELLAD